MTEFFFIVGAQRSGTTYLCQICDEHPEIEMAKPVWPEPKFFLTDALFERGLEYYRSHYFHQQSGARVWGEKSVSYMETEKSARRIAESFPSAKILFILRDPIQRAISNYWFTVNNGLEELPLEEAFLREEERWRSFDPERISVSPYAYLRRGRYIDHILMYGRYFPAESLKILVYEQFVGSATLARDLYAFLSVPPDFTPPSLDRVINASHKRDVTLSPEVERYMRDYFAEPTARLAEYLGLPLAEWQSFGS